ncbi:hypothetical protein ACQP00_27890 [Dactylosporangium sp. CS-047395]|uniref:hypothetical protein n=1 Tax=Dactylosporangium sp. CS-047395 TaxID=3239936 RepID=UPI003D9007B0
MARLMVSSVARLVFVARGPAAWPGSAVGDAHGGDAVAPVPAGAGGGRARDGDGGRGLMGSAVAG